ncbi:MAG: hypothetical protein WEB58_13630 [Planctomycetaceae bacterium]|jgi:hypothetical protein
MYRAREAFPLILIIIGVIWCIEIVKRREEDWESIKTSKEPADKYIVIGFWLATAAIIYFLATSGVSYVMHLVKGVIDLAR